MHLFDDAGMEIAFVLDGSGNIEKEDFERVKDFISNLMISIWTTCFSVSKTNGLKNSCLTIL